MTGEEVFELCVNDRHPDPTLRSRGHPLGARARVHGAPAALGAGGDDPGLDHRLCRRIGGERGPAGDRPRPRGLAGQPAMGDQRLHALPRGLPAGGRRGRRPAGTAPRLHRGRRPVRRGLSRLRPLARDRAADRGARGAGRWVRRCSFPVRSPSSVRPSPKTNAAAPSAPGRASPPSPPPSGRCWAAGSSITWPGRRSSSSTRCFAWQRSGSPGAICRRALIPERRPASTGRARCWLSSAWPAWPSA